MVNSLTSWDLYCSGKSRCSSNNHTNTRTTMKVLALKRVMEEKYIGLRELITITATTYVYFLQQSYKVNAVILISIS